MKNPKRASAPEKSRFTSTKGDVPANRISIQDLLERLALIPDLRADQMIDDLGLDRDELYSILDSLAKSMPRDSFQTTRGGLHGVLSWGIAIGYFFAKQSTPYKVN